MHRPERAGALAVGRGAQCGVYVLGSRGLVWGIVLVAVWGPVCDPVWGLVGVLLFMNLSRELCIRYLSLMSDVLDVCLSLGRTASMCVARAVLTIFHVNDRAKEGYIVQKGPGVPGVTLYSDTVHCGKRGWTLDTGHWSSAFDFATVLYSTTP